MPSYDLITGDIDTEDTPKRGRPTTDERLAAIHAEALQEFDDIWAAQQDVRLQCAKERRFYSIPGAQWEGPLAEQFENKPKFEVNKCHLAVIRIFNEYRNNRIGVMFEPKDGARSPMGDDLADTCAGLYRADEQASTAEEAYDNAFEEGVGGGMGAWRLRAKYEDEDEENDQQRVCMEPIYDADSCVFFDLDAKRQDKADAKRCFVLTGMSPKSFEAEYGHSPTSWPKDLSDCEFDWYTPDVVYVAEYYCVKEKKERVQVWEALDGQEQRVTDAEIEDGRVDIAALKATGSRKVREKTVKRRQVHKYLLSGLQVEEDCGVIAGKHIPIIPFYGKRWYVDGIERCQGHVRLAMDASRLANMQRSKLGEISALSSVEKPILTPEQVAGHTVMWSDDNVKNFPYLLVNPMTDASGQKMAQGPIGYTKPPQVPPAMAALLQITEQDLQDLLGNPAAGEQLQPNQSGKAVELVQNRLDMQAFIYMSNFAKAVKRSGQVWLSMARDLLIEEGRKLKTITAQGETSSAELLTPAMDAKTGKTYLANDMSNAKFDIVVDVGPSSSSKRAATVRAVSGLRSITQDPQTGSVLEAVALMNMEGEGLSDVRDYFRQKLVRAGVIKPTDEEAEAMAAEAQGRQPDPQSHYLQAAAEQARADAANKRASTVLTIAKSELTEAQTRKTLSEVGLEGEKHDFAVGKALHDAGKPAPTAPAVR